MKLIFSLVLICVAILAGGRSFEYAQAGPEIVGLTISPPSFELSANPGEKREEAIKITNQSTDRITYQATAEDFTVQGTEGIVSLTQDEDNPNAFSKWFIITPGELTLEAKETKLVKFAIDVPQQAEPGGHFASILFQPKVIAKQDASGARVVQRIGALILLTVSGSSKEQARIERFNPKSFSGLWEDITGSDGKTIIHAAKDEKFNDEYSKRYFKQGPVTLDVLFKNEGNVHIKPIGTVTIYNIFGMKVDQSALNPRNVFPGAERRVTIIWPKKNLWGGYYRAQLVAIYGTKNQTLIAETSFFAFPLWAATAIGILLAFLIIARHRLIKIIRVLIQG